MCNKAELFIPKSEKWLYKKETVEKLERALLWAKTNKVKDNFEEVIKKLKNFKNKNYP